MSFADLTRIALLGTEHQAVPRSTATDPLGKLKGQVDLNQRERALLSLAALDALHERIGGRLAQDDAPLPSPSPSESQPPAGEAAASLLVRFLAGEAPELLPEWLTLAAQAAQVARPEALPPLLQLGGSRTELRDAIRPVLGARGHWLASQNPDWAWVGGEDGDDETAWQTGERAQRLAVLARLRRTHPARARELLSSTWKDEAPEDRATFLGTFATGLGPDDEPFLEAALDDRRQEVRRTAVALLARLPGSSLVRRLTERARLLLRWIPADSGAGVTRNGNLSAVVEVSLPAECPKALQRDGIESKPPPGFGEKAWWLIQVLEAVPLNLWTREWNCTPMEILSASRSGEWAKELFEAWWRGVIRQRNEGWAGALFDAVPDGALPGRREGLLDLMSPSQREERLAILLSDANPVTRAGLGPLVVRGRHGWSPGFSRAVLDFLRLESARVPVGGSCRNPFQDFAVRLAPEVLAEALVGWPVESPGWEFWAQGVDEFLTVTQLRIELRTAFAHGR